VTGDEIFSGRRRVLPCISDVVDPFEHDDMRRTRVGQHVTFEARHCIDAGANGSHIDSRRDRGFAQHSIAADACVQNSHLDPLS
jgi:hypothetical protein